MDAGGFLVMAHGTEAEAARARTILAAGNPARLDMHAGLKTAEPPRVMAPAIG